MTGIAPIPDQIIRSAPRTLSRDRLLRRRLPGWGQVHIDRKQPFLCVYRRPPDRDDPGTDQFLLSQASYLLASGDRTVGKSLRALIDGLAGELSAAFGRVILLELWAAPGKMARDSKGSPGPPAFRLVVPAHAFPQSTLETIEAALVAANWPGATPGILIHYAQNPAPPDLPPLFPAGAAEKRHCTLLGLEVPPIYRDEDSGAIYPDVLRAMQRELGHVLKQMFFSFSHSEGSYRPAHFHELGRRAMTKAVWEVDRQLGEIGDSFDLLLHLTPTNAEAAWNAFHQNKFARIPEFHYRPRTVDPAALKRQLYRVPVDRIEDPALYAFFERKQDELDRQITMLGDRGTPNALYGSLQIYGRPGAALLDQARKILETVAPHTGDDSATDFVDAETFAYHAETELVRLRGSMPDLPATVQLRDDVPGLMVSRGRLLIGREARIAKSRIAATIQHEIGTHILTYYNGLSQPFRQLHTGSAGYEELQEGIAVLAEYLVGGLSRPRLRMLGGRVIAADAIVGGATFVDTFQLLHDEHGFNQKTAYTIAMRVHRGGGLTKDLVYLRGITRLLEKIAAGVKITDLLVGKIAFDDLEVVEELVWRKVLKPAPLRPSYLDDPKTRKTLRRIASDKPRNILDLIAGDLG